MRQALLWNVGNTHTRLLAWQDGALLPPGEAHDTPALLAPAWASPLAAAHPDWPWVVACVVPAVRARLAESARGVPRHWVDAALAAHAGVDLSAMDATTMGADRLANAIAARHELALPAIVLDCGTALTTTVVDAAGRCRGGAILPGRQLARTALHRGTGQLPALALGDDRPAAIGANTRDALRAGVDLGLLGAVERLLAETRRELAAPGATVVAIGGDAAYFCRHLGGVVAGAPDFTCRGLALLAARL